jgi:phosphoribosylaminoimidazolecarboxamide formyltransferase/IMP cyclohydrolase
LNKLALISVYDKRGLRDYATALADLGWRFLASGGTLRFLEDSGLQATSVEEWTGFPDRFGGRVKTLHPRIFAGILASSDPNQEHALMDLGIQRIGLVTVNLYPFVENYEKGLPPEQLAEFIDIGGPSLLRAAAKNCDAVIPVCDSADYDIVVQALRDGRDDIAFRRGLAAKAFRVTAAYDAAIASAYTRSEPGETPNPLAVGGWKSLDLRYGENPHQGAGYYTMTGLPGFQVLQGKPLSYNNLVDATAALEFASLFREQPFCVIIKHANPAGAAAGENTAEAFLKAFNVDSLAAFGGIIGFSAVVDEPTAREVVKSFFEVVVAPDYSDGAVTALTQKKNLRVIRVPHLQTPAHSVRTVLAGFVFQEADNVTPEEIGSWECVSGEPADEPTKTDLAFAWRVAMPMKSNAIAVARDGVLIGIGCGQTSRVRAVRYALEQAGENARGGVLASDAFFPFPDSIELAVRAGIRAVVAPKGSIRDADVADRARSLGLTLYFAPRRHFRH